MPSSICLNSSWLDNAWEINLHFWTYFFVNLPVIPIFFEENLKSMQNISVCYYTHYNYQSLSWNSYSRLFSIEICVTKITQLFWRITRMTENSSLLFLTRLLTNDCWRFYCTIARFLWNFKIIRLIPYEDSSEHTPLSLQINNRILYHLYNSSLILF